MRLPQIGRANGRTIDRARPETGKAATPRRGQGDLGETLMETLATVVVIGIAMTALLAGIGTAIRMSGNHRSRAGADVALEVAAEAVKVYPVAGATCGAMTTSTYAGAIGSTNLPATQLPTGWTNSNLSITAASCVTVNGVSLPKITIKATGPVSGNNVAVSESVDVVRRSVT